MHSDNPPTTTIPLSEYESLISRLTGLEQEITRLKEIHYQVFRELMVLYHQEDDEAKKEKLSALMSILVEDNDPAASTADAAKFFMDKLKEVQAIPLEERRRMWNGENNASPTES